MHILWDMDGPIVQFEKRVHDILLKHIPPRDVIPLEARTTFRLRDQYHPCYHDMILEVMSAPGFYLGMEAVEGSLCAMNDMLANGYEVSIVTSPLIESRHCAQEKFEWVRDHLGDDWCKRLIIAYDKTTVKGDVLIDDKPDITGRGEREWRQVIYDIPFNRHLDRLPRLTKPCLWRDVIHPCNPALV